MYDNHKVIVFHLLSYASHLIPKLHGKMKHKLALLWSRINAKTGVFVVPHHISWKRITIRCLVTVDYCYSLCSHNSRIVLSNQNNSENELNIVFCVHFVLTNSKFLSGKGRSYIPVLQIFCMHRVVHNNGRWQRLSMTVATERYWVERLICKESKS